ncbi:MAG: DUF1194 domain-containing protein [Alphaproteobacteria bacterium]|nr:DUF1194 domain-containing protein [Alphaproteobacteria bacterium]
MVRCVAAAILALLIAREATAETEVDLQLALAVDISGSVDQDEALLQRQGYVAAFRDPEIIRAIKGGMIGKIAVMYFEWASYGDNRLLVDWMVIGDEASAHMFAALLAEAPIRTGLRTSITGAIDFALPRFALGNFRATRRVIDISGDGPNNDGGLIDLAREKAIAAGITINGLPIVNDRPNRFGFPNMADLDKYYEGCVIGGPGAFIVVAQDFASFGEAVRRKLLLEIAGLVPEGGRASVGRREAAQEARLAPFPPARGLLHRAQYTPGCDIGERRSRDFYQNRFLNPN